MHYPNDPRILEASDITAVYSDGAKRTLADGTSVLTLFVTVNPDAGKDYSVSFPQFLFVTNGVAPRLLDIQPFAEVATSVTLTHAVEPPSAPEVHEAESTPEPEAIPVPATTQPAEAVEVPATTEPAEAVDVNAENEW